MGVHVKHTSRFTRDATHARVVKKELRRAGVRVLSVTQELAEDPMGAPREGFFECIDQYDLRAREGSLRAAASDRVAGRASAKPRVLNGLARCGICGSSYQLETSGKSLAGATYSYCYYNCRKTLRAGKKACPGFRVLVEDLDGAVLTGIADGRRSPRSSQPGETSSCATTK